MNDQEEKGIPVRIKLTMILIVAILAFVIFTRLYNLQVKALMHDECMFIYYSWHLAKQGDYLYQPILHGPVLEEMTALMFILFGDSDYTMRLFPALCGIGLIFLLLGFKTRLGREGMVAALALFALSPFLMFYSRFCRNDVPFALFSILTFYLYWKFYRKGGGITLIFAIISSMMLICIKENQLIYFFTIYTFAALLFIVDIIKGYIHKAKGADRSTKHRPIRQVEEEFTTPPIIFLALLGGIVFYVLGTHANYYEFRALGLLGIILYFLMMFRRYYSDVASSQQTHSVDDIYSVFIVFVNAFALTFFCWVLYKDLFSGLATLNWSLKIIIALLVFFFAGLYVINKAVKGGFGEDHLLRRFVILLGERYWQFVIGLALASIIYIILFSTWFKHPEPALGYYKKTFEYWAGQHKEHRIKGEFHFYLPILAVYDLPALLIVLAGTIVTLWREKFTRKYILSIYIILLALGFYYFMNNPISEEKWKKLESVIYMTSYFHFFLFYSVAVLGTALVVLFLWRKERFNAFCAYWSMGSFLGYSYAGEKVPWISVHIIVPILLLAAVYIQKLWNTSFFRKTAIAWYVLFSLFTLWNLKSSLVVSFVNHSNIAERMIYSHAPMDVPKCAKEAEQIAFQLGTKEKTKILVKGWAIWPMRWYLRNYDWTEWEKPEDTTFPMVIMDYDAAMKIDNLKDNYHISKYVVIQWWVTGRIDIKRLANIWKVLIPKQYTRGKDLGTDIDNSKAEWRKIKDYLLYRKIYEAHDARFPSISAPEMAFCVRKNLLER
jgi:uncharacterized protein (TIGR03663 family)